MSTMSIFAFTFALISFAGSSGALTLGSNSANFVPVPPCRVADTRQAPGPFGGPDLLAGMSRDFPIPASSCGIPANASAYSLNVTVVPKEPLGNLTIWPTGQPLPVVSTLNAWEGQVVANAAIVPAGTNGSVSVYVTNQTDLVIDINGYFTSSGFNANLAFNLDPGTAATPIMPHPFESDQGWGGGARPEQLIDGFRGCNDPSGWACGLAFTGGNNNWGGQACGARQATIDLGSTPVQVSAVRITHHGDDHVPQIYQIQTWDGTQWIAQASITNNTVSRCSRVPGSAPQCMITDEFYPVQTTKVRYTFNNCPDQNSNILGQSITHGWLYEFEVYRLPN